MSPSVKQDTAHILVVDPDRAVQRQLADALAKQGFAVKVEGDGDWAIKTLERRHFDALILDMNLSGTDAAEVSRRLRSSVNGRKTMIVLMSNGQMAAAQQRDTVHRLGAFAFLDKPLKLSMLYGTLKDALGERYPVPLSQQAPPPPAEDDTRSDPTETLADINTREEIKHVETQVTLGTGVFSLRGDFTDKPFPEVLAEIHRWKASGALLLRRDKAKVKKIVYFREGLPTSIKSNVLSECLGRILVREKMISEGECEDSIKKMKDSGRQQGTVLIEMGAISPHNLVHALTIQLQTKLFDIFTWEGGEYQFNPRIAPPPDVIELGMTPAAVIYEGVRRSFDARRLEQGFGSVSHLYVHPPDSPLLALQDAGLGDEEQQLLTAADGHQTVATLRALAILPPLDTDRLLYAMRCAQMIELKPIPAEGRAVSKVADSLSRPPPLPPAPPVAEPPPLPSRALTQPDALPTMPGGPPGLPTRPPPSMFTPSAPPVPTEPPVAKARPRKEPERSSKLLPELSEIYNPERMSSEDSILRERLAARMATLRKQTYFEIFGLPTNAGREDIKRAYFALAKEYHPDRHFGSASAEVRELAQQIYDLISTAHDTLNDPTERARYTQELESGVKRELGDEVNRILAAEGKFQKGEELLRQHDFRGAHELFEQAIALYADEGEFHAYWGWSLFQQDPKSPATVDRALRALEKAANLNPRVDRCYLFTGYIYKATGRPDKAEKQFEKAIQCNPDCTEALRELRLLGRPR